MVVVPSCMMVMGLIIAGRSVRSSGRDLDSPLLQYTINAIDKE